MGPAVREEVEWLERVCDTARCCTKVMLLVLYGVYARAAGGWAYQLQVDGVYIQKQCAGWFKWW